MLKKLPWGFHWRSSKYFILTVVIISLFLDLFLYGLIVPVLPFILHDRLHLPPDRLQIAASILLASHAVATFLTAPLIGLSIDGSLSRRHGFLLGLVVTLGATVFLCFGNSLWQLIIARLLQGASAAIVWIVGLAIVTDTVPPDHLGKALGTVYSATTLGALLSPTIGGLVYTKFGYYPVYYLAGALLSIDIVLRILVIDKEEAVNFIDSPAGIAQLPSIEADERSLLLGSNENRRPEPVPPGDIQDEEERGRSKSSALQPSTSPKHCCPIITILADPRLLAATFVTFTHACLVGMFNATLPIHVQTVFGMSSLESGLLFIAIELPYVFCGPAIGWYVDYAGPRGPASMGSLLLVPSLLLLRVPKAIQDLPLLVILLALNGTGLSAASSSAFVQANKIGRERHLENPVLFGSKGPYGQLYALNNILYSLGMTVGPLAAGALSSRFGYGNAMAVMSCQALLAAIISRAWMER
ncbi:hypothetical protein PTTG_05601 [Puccinia triticina 1-1 BBBD Race 1]|uniref:MFS domain-containing protein n=2 Tax=Puccinia triticina TaxID=208348 RepID=A0A180GKJ6_PUCT1|nr:uncharacterized protein PtA15_11A86 [Puccinia triticina]OAV93200.1 hypothetical protein PTTG_05601 [Puccinia triticina 1-1 BBBD Race 1]WAQ89399.1 hypothetical protein PtA15_11A86 [Puccinia triticina]WAR59452.1 hypothetical protein PtB15_11B92 [Puccinia triticina]